MAAKNMSKEMADSSRNKEVMAWKNKTDQAKKGELIREIHKLEIQIQALEREKGTHVYSKRSDFRTDFSQLEDQDVKATTERKTEKIKLRQQLEKISHMVNRFQRELKDVKPTPEFVEKLKVIMEDIEGTINTFKLQQRQHYEELMRDERTTMLEIQALEKRFEAWTQTRDGSTSARTSVKPPTTARDITKDLPPEVAAFERFLQQTGGVRGGWDEYDHQTFLKFRNRFKGRPVFMDKLIPALPTKTEGAIREHETWYQEYLYLMDAKKDAIKTWRIKKEEEKDEFLSHVDGDEEDGEGSDEEGERRRAQFKERVDEEKKQRFAQLSAWKVQKELERAQAEELKLRAEMAKSKKQEDEKKRQAELRARVEEHRQQRQEEETFLKLQQEQMEEDERDRRRQLSAREIAKFRERDKKVLSERVMKNHAKEDEEREKEKRKERIKRQVEMYVPHDPNRLLRPTKGWRERLKDPAPSGAGQVLHMPHRAVPSWRQGLH